MKADPPTDETYIISFSQFIKVDEYQDRKTGEIKPINMELRFLDSFRFMSSSLDKLASNLATEDLNILGKYYKNESFDLLRRRSKFDHTNLPLKHSFYSSLRGDYILNEDYKHAQKVWNALDCKNFKDYHMLYLQSDALLLADIFEKFRNICINMYGLDPVHYFTTPGLSWDALLKTTVIKLDLNQDPDMLLMIEKGIHGWISTVTHIYGKANNPYIPETYDKSKPNNYIIYLDANNLCGWAMSQSLLTGKFKWYKKELDVFNIPDNSRS